MTKSKTILVTGGAGYVGSHACKALSQSGYQPVVYDDLRHGHEEAVKWGPLIKGDIMDTAHVIGAIRSTQACAVMHFAAYAYVGESMDDPLTYYLNNVAGTLSLLRAMQETETDKIIFSSTCSIYGDCDEECLSESYKKEPVSPYGRSKWMIEQVLSDLAVAGKIKYVSLRYFNAAGADFEGEIGESHEPETHLIPLAIGAGHGGQPLKIMGTDYPTADGTAIRDYTHVCDLASAHVLALKHLLAENKSDFFNLGSGQGHSVLQIVETLRALGVPVHIILSSRRAGDPPCSVADITKAQTILGWQPEHSGLKEILTSALRWHLPVTGKSKHYG